MQIMEFDLKCVHVSRYELVLSLDGAIWLTIISQALLTPKNVQVKIRNPFPHPPLRGRVNRLFWDGFLVVQ